MECGIGQFLLTWSNGCLALGSSQDWAFVIKCSTNLLSLPEDCRISFAIWEDNASLCSWEVRHCKWWLLTCQVRNGVSIKRSRWNIILTFILGTWNEKRPARMKLWHRWRWCGLKPQGCHRGNSCLYMNKHYELGFLCRQHIETRFLYNAIEVNTKPYNARIHCNGVLAKIHGFECLYLCPRLSGPRHYYSTRNHENSL